MFAFKKSSVGIDINGVGENQKGALGQLLARAVETVYPARCMICETYTGAPHGLCPECWLDTNFIAGTKCCQCGSPLPGEGQDLVCDACMTFPPVWSKGAAAVVYETGGRKMVLALKHGDRLDLAPALARWMLAPAKNLLDRADIIAPVPLHRLRFLKRKFNQSAELSKHLARMSGIAHVPDLLTRQRRTPSQDGLNRAERMENQRGAFAVSARHLPNINGKSVLLVDDVLTTGATLSACAEVLYENGAENVNVCVLARVERGG